MSFPEAPISILVHLKPGCLVPRFCSPVPLPTLELPVILIGVSLEASLSGTGVGCEASGSLGVVCSLLWS